MVVTSYPLFPDYRLGAFCALDDVVVADTEAGPRKLCSKISYVVEAARKSDASKAVRLARQSQWNDHLEGRGHLQGRADAALHGALQLRAAREAKKTEPGGGKNKSQRVSAARFKKCWEGLRKQYKSIAFVRDQVAHKLGMSLPAVIKQAQRLQLK